MNQQIQAAIDEIASKINDDNFIYYCGQQCEILKKIDPSGESIDFLIRLFENNPSADFGTPGPMVHFIEKFGQKKYEEPLLDSIKRKPTSHTVWMLNRIINISKEPEKTDYLELFKSILLRQDIDNETRESVKDFLNFHHYQ
jgi:hypothetical protein